MDWQGEAALVRKSIQRGREKRRNKNWQGTPEHVAILARMPALDQGELELASAYVKLATERAYQGGPIRVGAIWTWMDRKGIADPRVCEHVENVITAVDAKLLGRQSAANRPTKEAPADSKRGGLRVPNRRRCKQG